MKPKKTIRGLIFSISLPLWALAWPGDSTADDKAQDLSGDRMAFVAAPPESLGDLETVAAKLSQADLVVLSFATDSTSYPNATDRCLSTKSTLLPKLIRRLRQLKPNQRIFGYVAATLDIPKLLPVTKAQKEYITTVLKNSGLDAEKEFEGNFVRTYCGNNLYDPRSKANWSCSNGICSNFIQGVNDWLAVEREANASIDGIFVDLVGPQWITETVRENIFSYVKLYKKKIMANVGVNGVNSRFAADSKYFGAGDYVLLEGFFVASGMSSLSTMENALDSYDQVAKKGVFMAALVSEAWAPSVGMGVTCFSPNHVAAYREYLRRFKTNNVFQYSTQDLGISSKLVQLCDHQELFKKSLE